VKFTSCFIGIPLPPEYQSEFEQALGDIATIDPLLEIAYSKTPHITSYYLNNQAQLDIEGIASIITFNMPLLRNAKLTVEGLGLFREEDPRTLYFEVAYPREFKEFNEALTKLLKKYNAPDNNYNFHPHLTLARLSNYDAQQSFKLNYPALKRQLSGIKWEFPITEIVIYGVDSTKHPQHQEKLLSIKV
jgi:2'-5' RNA ligase